MRLRYLLYCFGLPLLLMNSRATAQHPATATFDHLALYVRNLDSSMHFYSGLFHFDTLPHPTAKFRVQWFSIGDHLALHLAEGMKDTASLPFFVHPCFSVQSIDVFIKELDRRGIPYYSGPDLQRAIRRREDGVNQIFVKDPDKYWVEINDAKHF